MTLFEQGLFIRNQFRILNFSSGNQEYISYTNTENYLQSYQEVEFFLRYRYTILNILYNISMKYDVQSDDYVWTS